MWQCVSCDCQFGGRLKGKRQVFGAFVARNFEVFMNFVPEQERRQCMSAYKCVLLRCLGGAGGGVDKVW